MKILVIGDAHVEQDQDLRRFDVLGKFIVEQRPEAIVSIGDFMEMACLSAWDADKRLKMEGLRYQKEIEAGNQALDLIDDKINAYNERQSENKKRQYNPQKVYVEGNHECVSLDTEVLTEGLVWIPAENIKPDTKIVTVNGNSQLVCEKPVAVLRTTTPNFIAVKGDLSDERVSETHRIYLDEELVPVKSLIGSSINNLRLGLKVKLNAPDFPVSDDDLRLIVWCVMDGCVRKEPTGAKCRVQFKLSKERKLAALREILDRMGIAYTDKECKKCGINKLQPRYIRFYGDAARRVHYDLLNGVKRLPKWFVYLSERQVRIVLDELVGTDASLQYNHISWTSTNKWDVEIIQTACFLNGIPCKFKEHHNASGFANGKLQYKCYIYHNGLSDRRYSQVEETGEAGEVMAIQSVTGNLITRRNGKISVTGNCRLTRYLERDPTFVGFADIRKDLRVDSRKWVWVPYGDDIKIRGISFTHIPFSANGKPISGNDIANKAHRVYNNSVVFGHTHQLVYQAFQRKNGSRQQVLNVGCYYEHQPDYIEKAPTAHFKGVVLMTVGEDGEFDIQTISIKSLLRDYTG